MENDNSPRTITSTNLWSTDDKVNSIINIIILSIYNVGLAIMLSL